MSLSGLGHLKEGGAEKKALSSKCKGDSKSSVWWKPWQSESRDSSLATTKKAMYPISSAIREINGKLCGIDLHDTLDVPLPKAQFDRKRETRDARADSPGEMEYTVRPLSFKRPNSPTVSAIQDPKPSTDHARTTSSRTVQRISNLSAGSDTSSVYSVEASSQDNGKRKNLHTRNHPFSSLSDGLNIQVGRFSAADYQKELGECFPATPVDDLGFPWENDKLEYKEGVISGVDSQGRSVYKKSSPTPIAETSRNSPVSVYTTKRVSIDNSVLQAPTITNPSTPGSNIFHQSFYSDGEEPASDSMLAFRNQLVQDLPDDDELSDATFRPIKKPRPSVEETKQSREDEEAPKTEDIEPNLIELYTDQEDCELSDNHVELDGENDDLLKTGTPHEGSNVNMEASHSTMSRNKQLTVNETVASEVVKRPNDLIQSLLEGRIGGLEPQSTGLKRLPSQRRKCGQGRMSRYQALDTATIMPGYVNDPALEEKLVLLMFENEDAVSYFFLHLYNQLFYLASQMRDL
ncbi:hypothetical protein ABW20_dc0108353 [Dactylellina cionopaga]|nr:hypothetical protein ABW20_dc0108353 [Dactylellina cionopaga]